MKFKKVAAISFDVCFNRARKACEGSIEHTITIRHRLSKPIAIDVSKSELSTTRISVSGELEGSNDSYPSI
jgi:hypothetical protein